MRGALLLAVVVLAGCPHSDDPSLEPITGRWRAVPSTFNPDPLPVDQREIVEFGLDGSFHADSQGQITTGTYTTDGGRLQVTIDDADGAGGDIVRDLDFARFNDRLSIIALRPVGTVDGVEGTWHTVTITEFPGSEPVEETLDLEVLTGGVARVTAQNNNEPASTSDGSWQFDGAFVHVDTPLSIMDLAFIGGTLGQFSYELIGN